MIANRLNLFQKALGDKTLMIYKAIASCDQMNVPETMEQYVGL
jgi:hypothetical protein